MKRPIVLLAVAALAAGLSAVSQAQDAPTSRPVDLAPIAGEYTLVTASRDGQPAPPHMSDGMRVVIGDGKVSIRVAGRSDDATVTAIDPTKTPATIDMASPKGDAVLGIYKLEAGQLSLCFTKDGERPKSFEPGKDIALLVLKRDAAGASTKPSDD